MSATAHAGMGISSIRLCGFRRYTDERIALVPGVNFLEGPNNAGKTTVLYAIEYALFGRVGLLTAEGLLKPGADGVGVEIVFDGRDGKRYRLQRVHLHKGKAKTKGKGKVAAKALVGHFTLKTIDEEGRESYVLSSDFDHREDHLATALHSALGVGRRAWDLAVHLRQGAIPELLGGSSQLDIVLGVTPAVFVEEEIRAMARERERALDELPAVLAVIGSVEAERDTRRTRLRSLEAEVEAERAKISEFDMEKEALRTRRRALTTIEEQIARISSGERGVERAKEEIARTEAAQAKLGAREALEASCAAAASTVAWLTDAQREEREAIAQQRTSARGLDRERGDLAARLARSSELVAQATCEHCGQTIDPQHLAQQREQLETALAGIDAQVATAEQQLASSEAAAVARQEELTAAKVAERDAVRAKEALSAAAEQSESALQALTRAQEALEQALVDIAQRDVDALRARHAQEQEEIRTAEIRLEADQKHIRERLDRVDADLKVESAALRTLDRQYAESIHRRDQLKHEAAIASKLRALDIGFKAVQQELREAATARLAVRTLALHALLSGEQEEIGTLSIDPKGYAVLVTPHDVGTEVPAALYQGGGHRLLLGLAFRLALAEQLGPIPFVLLDEPTYGLDSSRRAALLARISSLAVADQLIVITHHDLGQTQGHRVRVVPDGVASRLEVA